MWFILPISDSTFPVNGKLMIQLLTKRRNLHCYFLTTPVNHNYMATSETLALKAHGLVILVIFL